MLGQRFCRSSVPTVRPPWHWRKGSRAMVNLFMEKADDYRGIDSACRRHGLLKHPGKDVNCERDATCVGIDLERRDLAGRTFSVKISRLAKVVMTTE